MVSKSREKAWRYVGRFMDAFASVEAAVDNIFEIMFNLNATSLLLLLGTLDLRKKVKLLELGFEQLEISVGDTLNRINEFS